MYVLILLTVSPVGIYAFKNKSHFFANSKVTILEFEKNFYYKKMIVVENLQHLFKAFEIQALQICPLKNAHGSIAPQNNSFIDTMPCKTNQAISNEPTFIQKMSRVISPISNAGNEWAIKDFDDSLSGPEQRRKASDLELQEYFAKKLKNQLLDEEMLPTMPSSPTDVLKIPVQAIDESHWNDSLSGPEQRRKALDLELLSYFDFLKKINQNFSISKIQLIKFHLEINDHMSKISSHHSNLVQFLGRDDASLQWQYFAPVQINDQIEWICFVQWDLMPEHLKKIGNRFHAIQRKKWAVKSNRCIQDCSIEWQCPLFIASNFNYCTTSALWFSKQLNCWYGANVPLTGQAVHFKFFRSADLAMLLGTFLDPQMQ